MQCKYFLAVFFCLLTTSVYADGLHRIILSIGQTKVELFCPNVTSWVNPYGDVIETSNTRPKYSLSGGNLTIFRIDEHDVGTWHCKSDNGTSSIELESPPLIKPLDKSLNVVQGEPVELQCFGFGYPKPSFNWSRVMDDGTLKTISNNATLVIKSTIMKDYGIYTCMGMNEHGTANQTTKIRVKDKLAPLWPFIGIVLEVVVLVVIIIIYERRKRSKETEDSLKSK